MGLTDSQMAMWSTIVALVYADGRVHDEEKRFLQERFSGLSLSDTQREALLEKLNNPDSPKEAFKKITEPRDRSQVIYFARLLFYSDGEFSVEEQKILEHLNSEAMAKVDLKRVMHEIDDVVLKYKIKQQAYKDSQPIHKKIINALIFWVDLDQD